MFLHSKLAKDVSKNFNLWLLMRGCTTNSTLQGTNISHLGNRKIIFNMPFLGDMLVPWRVVTAPKSGCSQLFWQIYDIWISESILISWLLCTGCSNSLLSSIYLDFIMEVNVGNTPIHWVLTCFFLVCFDEAISIDWGHVASRPLFSWAVYSNLSRARARSSSLN